MTFECLAPDEIRVWYNQAKNKEHIILVLAQLTCSTELEIADFLGVEIQSTGKLNKRLAYKFYQAKMSDQQIAEKLGVSRVAVRNWRIERELPQLDAKPGHEERMEVYRSGLSDRQAAAKLGIGRSTFRHWREQNGLAPNDGRSKTA